MRARNPAEAALANNCNQNNLKRETIVGAGSGPARAVEGKVPKEPKAECERVKARGRGRDGVESSCFRAEYEAVIDSSTVRGRS